MNNEIENKNLIDFYLPEQSIFSKGQETGSFYQAWDVLLNGITSQENLESVKIFPFIENSSSNKDLKYETRNWEPHVLVNSAKFFFYFCLKNN